MTEHYLDNAATTEVSEVAREAMEAAIAVYGNPSSTHVKGAEAARLLGNSRAAVAESLGVRAGTRDRVVFTASGTEANCTAIIGSYRSKARRRDGTETVVIGDGEHPSVENAAKALENEGCRLIRVPTAGGVLDIGYLRDALGDCREVFCAAFMLVNNETGAIYSVKEASAAVKERFPDAVVHCDAVQGFGRVRFTPATLGVDTLAVSAHKIHAPRGAGALYISGEVIKRKNIAPILPGGGQEGGFRSGTENLISIAGFAAACRDIKKNFAVYREKVAALRKYLDEKLAPLFEKGLGVKKPAGAVPDIVNLTLPGIKSETMLNFLSGKGICVSAGSACSAYSKKTSPALTAFGCSPEEIDSSVRVSLSHTNTEEDVAALADGLAEGIGRLARIKR